jgi:hypothetical protein
MLFMRERIRSIVDEKVAVVAFVAEGVDLIRLIRGIVRLVFPLDDGPVIGTMRAARFYSGGCPLVVVVAVSTIDQTRGGVTGLKAAHGGVPASGRDWVE